MIESLNEIMSLFMTCNIYFLKFQLLLRFGILFGEGEEIRKLKSSRWLLPLQAWTGPEGSRKLRFPDFVTMAQDGGKVVSLTHRPPLPPGITPGTHFC